MEVRELIDSLDQETKQNIMRMSGDSDPVAVIDMSYHLYRYFFALNMLSVEIDGKTFPTGHMTGFLSLIMKLREAGYSGIIVCVDGYDEERKKLNSEYRSGRSSDRYNVHNDVDDILSMISLIPNVYVCRDSGKEADDLIYSSSKLLRYLFDKNGLYGKEVHIFGNDRDLYQTLQDGIYMIKDTKSMKKIAEEDVIEEFKGVPPECLAMYRAIVGDSSDNLSGYYRFPKKMASFISRNCVISESEIRIKDGADITGQGNVKKYLGTINEDYSKFWSNYQIMKLDWFPFSIQRHDTSNGMYLLEKYRQAKFSRKCAVINQDWGLGNAEK